LKGSFTNLARNVVTNVDLLVVEQHSIDGLDSIFSGLCGFVVDETIALGSAVLIGSDFAGQDVTESREGIVERLSGSITSQFMYAQ
jgi:hypothetical protein